MSVGDWVAAAVGLTILLGVVWRLLRSVHNGVNLIHDLREDVANMHQTLNNGLRSEVKDAAEQAKKAQVLAAEAAQKASIANQHAVEGRHELTRTVNALRGELDIYTNVVMTDRHHIRAALLEAGITLSEPDL